MSFNYTLLILFLLQIVPSNANGGKLQRIGSIQFVPNINGTDSTGASDVWGWTGPDSTEYAIMGIAAGVAIINTNIMEVVSIVPGPAKPGGPAHRDIKTYRNYAYVVNENTGVHEGLMIIDLKFLPDSAVFIRSIPIDTVGGFRSHNLSIDTSKGFAYIEGHLPGVLSIFDLSDPENPTYVAEFPNNGFKIHDLYARNDTLYIAESGFPFFSIWDLTNKIMPKLLVRKQVSEAGFVHNVWPTDDGKYLLSTQEAPDITVKMWDISILKADSIKIVGEWLGTSRLAHNVHVKGNYAYVSHYESGIHVLDISDPENIFENASFDTYLQSDNEAFNGAWGVYPYTQNGTVFVSNIEGRLDVFEFDSSAVITAIDYSPLLKQPLLVNNYPNPFNPTTTIEFYLPQSAEVKLSVYNLSGQLIQTLLDEHLSSGTYSPIWSGANVASGLYFYRLQTNNAVTTGKMVLVK